MTDAELIEKLRSEVERLTHAVAQRDQDLNYHRNADLRSQVFALRADRDALRREVEQMGNGIADLFADRDALRSELAAATKAEEAAWRSTKELRAERDALREALDTVMAAPTR